MLLSEYLTEDIISAIPYISENENDNVTYIYNWMIANYGERTVAPIANISDKSVLGKIIDLMYADKWKTLKSATLADIGVTGTKDHKTETETNNIYGYNGNDAPDYKNIKETEETKEFSNIFEMIEKNIEFRELLSYYNVVVHDIANAITLKVY